MVEQTPAPPPRPLLPVLVWVHGGGFCGGSGANKWFNSTRLAPYGQLVITFNYRLGPLGFLATPGAHAHAHATCPVQPMHMPQAQSSPCTCTCPVQPMHMPMPSPAGARRPASLPTPASPSVPRDSSNIRGQWRPQRRARPADSAALGASARARLRGRPRARDRLWRVLRRRLCLCDERIAARRGWVPHLAPPLPPSIRALGPHHRRPRCRPRRSLLRSRVLAVHMHMHMHGAHACTRACMHMHMQVSSNGR